MKKFAVIDAETDPFKFGRIPQPFIWGFYDGQNFLEFEKTETLVDYLSHRDITVYAHNGGKFDFHFLLPWIKGKILVVNGRIMRAHIGKCELRDSWGILPVPLSAIEKDKFDYSLMEPEVRALHMDKIRQYLHNDCVYLYDAIKKFRENYGDKLTLASAAMSEWEKIRGRVSGTREHHQFFSPYYYGGRVTPFVGGVVKNPVKVVDINSAYPKAMTKDHPIGSRYIESTSVKDAFLNRSFLTIECRSDGALPVRDKGLHFPHDKGVFHITGHEFKAAMKTDSLRNVKILKAYIFERAINFTEYVDRFYREKMEAEAKGDKTGRLLAKLMLNALYGKFAANPDRYEEHLIGDYGAPPPGFIPHCPIGDSMLFSRPLEDKDMRWYDIVTAASITGWVRAYLWRSLQAVDTPYYCDTDSIICNGTGNLSLSDNLGDWKLEAKGDEVCIAGKKLYAVFDRGKAVKSASKGANLSPAEIRRVANGETIVYRPDAPTFSLSMGQRFVARTIQRTA